MVKKKLTNVLIAGCGDTGNALAKILISQGHSVWGVKRDTATLLREILPIQYNLLTSEFLNEWPSVPVDYVVYCVSASKHTEDDYHNAYIKCLQNTINIISQMKYPIKRFFFISSSAVYHQQNGEWVDEQSATKPESMSGKIMLQAESIAANCNFSSTVVRFSGIYGPNRTYLIRKILEQKMGYSELPVIYGNRIHIKDCAGVLAFLINKDLNKHIVDSCYLATDSNPAALSEVSNWLGCKLNISFVNKNLTYRANSKRCSNKKIITAGYKFEFANYMSGYLPLLNLL